MTGREPSPQVSSGRTKSLPDERAARWPGHIKVAHLASSPRNSLLTIRSSLLAEFVSLLHRIHDNLTMSALPETIKALQVLPERKGVQVVTIPWASQEKVKNLADDEIVVRVRAAGLNPTDWKVRLGDR